ncbi:MAG: glycosyltransferase [Fidelibacterota bacterium]|nr:MAG: glycosyltransferase [Candidatus Neomarinimicrobiota bacterium]
MKSELPGLKRHFAYQKFKSPPYRFLFLKYDYFQQYQLLKELRHQGHEVLDMEMPKELASKDALRLILDEAVSFKPDALMAFNNMGLDHNGMIMGVLSDLSLPVLIWYLDNFYFSGPLFTRENPEFAIAFSTDKALIPTLKDAGFPHAFYLPLATDLSYSSLRYDERFAFLRDKVSYVGGTFGAAEHHFHKEKYEALYRDWAPDFTLEIEQHGRVDLETVFAPFREHFIYLRDYYSFIAYVVFYETRRYRVGRLTSLLDEPLAIFGRDTWRTDLPTAIVHPPVKYHHETPNVYRNSAINLSLTTFQMETALNQRHFDVPLCNGFLLTDWKDALADHFELETEVAYFRNENEMKEKVNYYLKHPAAREKITARARERILHEHLMEHRVQAMLEMIREALA